MSYSTIFDSSVFSWVVLPILIFLARIVDVSIGTLRLIFISKGLKILAAVVGFFEVLIWLLAITQIMRNLSNPLCFLAFAAGFAMGNFVGITIENKIALGNVILRIITKKDARDLVEHLRSQHYGITTLDAEGPDGPVKIIFMVVSRQNLTELLTIMKKYNPNAFYSIEDVRFVKEGIFPPRKNLSARYRSAFPKGYRREK